MHVKEPVVFSIVYTTEKDLFSEPTEKDLFHCLKKRS
jgi:hypothetical protein